MRPSALVLKDGRKLTGAIIRQDGKTLVVQTAEREEILAADEVESVRQLRTSLMPEGLLTPLTESQVRDLIAYLQSDRPIR